jgi:mgtE-like transporter
MLSLVTTSIPLSIIMYSLGYIISIKLGKIVDIHYSFFMLYPLFVSLVTFLGYSIAFLSYRFGLDPDNVTVPFITTLADLVGTTFTILVSFW